MKKRTDPSDPFPPLPLDPVEGTWRPGDGAGGSV